MADPTLRSDKYESSVVRTDAVVWFVVGLALLTLFAALSAYYLLGGFRPPAPVADQFPSSMAQSRAVLQATPMGDLKQYREDKLEQLNSYQWIDRDQGRVRIPIDRAMQLMVERHREGRQ